MDSVFLTYVDWARATQRLHVVHNGGALTLPEGLLLNWSDTLCRRALRDGSPLTDDVPAGYPDSSAGTDLRLQTYLTVPVTDPHGNLFGTLCGASSSTLTAHDTHLATFRLFARLIGEHLPRTRAET